MALKYFFSISIDFTFSVHIELHPVPPSTEQKMMMIEKNSAISPKTERNFVHVKETWGCVTRRIRRRKRTSKKMRNFSGKSISSMNIARNENTQREDEVKATLAKIEFGFRFADFFLFFWPFQYHFPLPHQPSLLLSLLCYLVCHLIAAAAAMVVDWAFSLHFICSSFTFHYALLSSSPLCAILIEFSRAWKRECCWRN